MQDKAYDLVKDFIVNELDINISKISLNSTLSDFGLDGEDVLEFLLKFFKKFNIEFENSNYLKYIPQESGFFLNTIKYFFKPNANITTQEIYVQDLVNSLINHSWSK